MILVPSQAGAGGWGLGQEWEEDQSSLYMLLFLLNIDSLFEKEKWEKMFLKKTKMLGVLMVL